MIIDKTEPVRHREPVRQQALKRAPCKGLPSVTAQDEAESLGRENHEGPFTLLFPLKVTKGRRQRTLGGER